MINDQHKYVFYTYKISFLKGDLCGKYYIGKHKSRVPLSYSGIQDIEVYVREHPDFDRYVGSGVIPRNYFKKYEPILNETYKKEIISFYEDNEKCLLDEKTLVGDKYLTDDACCNCAPGGAGSNIFKQVPQNTREKISDALKKYYSNYVKKHGKLTRKWAGMKRGDENKKQISRTLKIYFQTHDNPFLGKHHTTSAKEKNSMAHKRLWEGSEYRENAITKHKEYWKTHIHPCSGRHLTDEEKAHLSEINVGKPNYKNRGSGNGMFGKVPVNARPVTQIDPITLTTINVFDSCDGAARYFGGTRGCNIKKVINGERKLAFGYMWKYKE